MSDRRAHLVAMPAGHEIGHAGYQMKGSFDCPELQLEDELFTFVRRHVLAHYVPSLAKHKPPRFAVVQGAPGEGKTVSVRAILSRLGVGVIAVEASELSGETEGAPVEAMKKIEEAVVVASRRDRSMMSVLIDDIDTAGFVRRENTEYTVNGQIVEGFLQSAGNGEHFKDVCGVAVPVFFTANDLTGVRGPVLRKGRAAFYTYAPGLETKTAMVKQVFAGADERAVTALVRRYADQPVAFFSDVRVRMAVEESDALFASYGMDVRAIEEALRTHTGNFDAHRMKSIAAELAGAKAGSYLRGRF